jgi:hypothetical protein
MVSGGKGRANMGWGKRISAQGNGCKDSDPRGSMRLVDAKNALWFSFHDKHSARLC